MWYYRIVNLGGAYLLPAVMMVVTASAQPWHDSKPSCSASVRRTSPECLLYAQRDQPHQERKRFEICGGQRQLRLPVELVVMRNGGVSGVSEAKRNPQRGAAAQENFSLNWSWPLRLPLRDKTADDLFCGNRGRTSSGRKEVRPKTF